MYDEGGFPLLSYFIYFELIEMRIDTPEAFFGRCREFPLRKKRYPVSEFDDFTLYSFSVVPIFILVPLLLFWAFKSVPARRYI